MSRSLSVFLTALVLGVAGCGGDDEPDTSRSGQGPESGGSVATPAPDSESSEPGSGEGNEEGKQIFAGTCGSCHTLADAGTSGTMGPNLDELKPDKDTVLTAIKEAPGSMPPNLVEGAQADTVAEYVSGAAGK